MTAHDGPRAAADSGAQLRNIITLIQQGQLQQAESLATGISNTSPGNADILHLLGMIKACEANTARTAS